MLTTILSKIPKKETAPFEGWDPPTLPAPAAPAAQKAAPGHNDGPSRSSSSASPPDAHTRHEKPPPTSNVAQTPTTPVVGGDETAAPKGGGEGRKHRLRHPGNDEGARATV